MASVARLITILTFCLAAAVDFTPTAEAAQVPGFGPKLGNSPAESSFGDSRDKVTIQAVPAQIRLAPGSNSVIAITLEHEPGWHTWVNIGNVPPGMAAFDGAINTEISIRIPADSPLRIHLKDIQWPIPHAAKADIGEGPQDYAVFSDRAIIYLPITVNETAKPGSVAFEAHITFQSCNERECLAPVFDHAIPISLEIVDTAALAASPPSPPEPAIFASFDATVFDRISVVNPSTQNTANVDAIPDASSVSSPQKFFGIPLPRAEGALGVVLLILLSMAGGFVLNLTPCVLPIIPIKILTISQHANTPGRSLTLGLWMAAGVVAFWAAIGIPAAVFVSAADPSRAFGIWWLTLGVGAIIALMGVGIMGLFTIQLPAAVYSVNPKADTAWGSFVFGIMTGVLGLPCFGFVAGALLVGAATMPALLIICIFTSIGVGMALPYLVLSANPALVNRIPRTGPASELVKQFMGLLLLAAAAYFVGSGLIILAMDEPYISKQLHFWAVAVFAVIAGLWLIMRTFTITKKATPRIAFSIIGLLLAAGSILFALDRTANARHEWEMRSSSQRSDDFTAGAWNDYTPERFAAARKAGHIVVLDFTATWCLTCQVLKATVLDPEPVKSAFEQKDVVVFTVDLSSLKAPGWGHLRSLGKTGIPLLAIYAPNNDKPWLANAYTPDQVMAALTDSRSKK